ncbi:hypothetical protein B0H63DRAFT_483805 [Podospora didyma]|uniref:Uncharacterized protein n=1 Tax=Podospora didyma TaxID=330526 RepID=A0AAE0K9X7_9PEZI|nr:hypothetical protein B0H63DRAFT_483805 [Podospora didyma]
MSWRGKPALKIRACLPTLPPSLACRRMGHPTRIPAFVPELPSCRRTCLPLFRCDHLSHHHHLYSTITITARCLDLLRRSGTIRGLLWAILDRGLINSPTRLDDSIKCFTSHTPAHFSHSPSKPGLHPLHVPDAWAMQFLAETEEPAPLPV